MISNNKATIILSLRIFWAIKSDYFSQIYLVLGITKID